MPNTVSTLKLVRAQRVCQAARLGYSRGLTHLQNALSAEPAWRTTRAQRTSAQVQAVRRAVQAYKAVGGGWLGAAVGSLASQDPGPDELTSQRSVTGAADSSAKAAGGGPGDWSMSFT